MLSNLHHSQSFFFTTLYLSLLLFSPDSFYYLLLNSLTEVLNRYIPCITTILAHNYYFTTLYILLPLFSPDSFYYPLTQFINRSLEPIYTLHYHYSCTLLYICIVMRGSLRCSANGAYFTQACVLFNHSLHHTNRYIILLTNKLWLRDD